MIATITMNPCIDKTIIVPSFTYGGLNHVMKKRIDISGKGINVSIVLENLGIHSIPLGLIYEEDKGYMLSELKKLNLDFKGVEVQGSLRENIKLLDDEKRITTELNQKGGVVSKQNINDFMSLLDEYLSDIELLVIDGSVPQGVEKDLYFRIIQRAKEKNITTLLDAEGELFLKGIEANPTIIKPNIYELKMAYGLKDDSLESIIEVCKKIIKGGVEIICVSMGEKGALIINEEESYFCSPSIDQVVSTQGAGDSMVAGICIAYQKKLPLQEMIKYAVAAAQGSLIREGTLLCQRDDFDRFYRVLDVKTIINKKTC